MKSMTVEERLGLNRYITDEQIHISFRTRSIPTVKRSQRWCGPAPPGCINWGRTENCSLTIWAAWNAAPAGSSAEEKSFRHGSIPGEGWESPSDMDELID